jgi:hypothetical protein
MRAYDHVLEFVSIVDTLEVISAAVYIESPRQLS